MRQQNFFSPEHQRACLTVTSSLYDRRALDCTAPLPLLTSLMHLSLMTASSQRVREALSVDGGLERLTSILETTPRADLRDRRCSWRWTLAYHCLANVGVRGTEQIRGRVERSGAIRIVIHVLESYLETMASMRMAREPAARVALPLAVANLTADAVTPQIHPGIVPTPPTTTAAAAAAAAATVAAGMAVPREPPALGADALAEAAVAVSGALPSLAPVSATDAQRQIPVWAANLLLNQLQRMSCTIADATVSEHTITDGVAHPAMTAVSMMEVPRNALLDELEDTVDVYVKEKAPPFREDDVMLALQLLAYLSKHSSIRDRLHANYPCNVFALAERFCARHHSSAMQMWAGVVMRNGCRKDDARGGLRRCAYLHCGKWESRPHEFAKCRRCRKAKYCSKECQSHAWSDGHRYWCIARQSSAAAAASAAANAANATATSTPATADQVVAIPPAATAHAPITAITVPTPNAAATAIAAPIVAMPHATAITAVPSRQRRLSLSNTVGIGALTAGERAAVHRPQTATPDIATTPMPSAEEIAATAVLTARLDTALSDVRLAAVRALSTTPSTDVTTPTASHTASGIGALPSSVALAMDTDGTVTMPSSTGTSTATAANTDDDDEDELMIVATSRSSAAHLSTEATAAAVVVAATVSSASSAAAAHRTSEQHRRSSSREVGTSGVEHEASRISEHQSFHPSAFSFS